MKFYSRKQQYGFTLLELLVTVIILAVMAAIAVPNFRTFIDQQNIKSVLNEWQSVYYFTQREAMRLKQPVIFCGSDNGKNCTANKAHDFSKGWIVYYAPEKGDKIILQNKAILDNTLRVVMNNENVFKDEGLKFLANGRLKSSAGTLTVELANGTNRHSQELEINVAGRLSRKD